MAYAPTSTHFDRDGTILGCFNEREFGKHFEFSKNPAYGVFEHPFGPDEFPHLVWISDYEKAGGWPYRYARVLKTVAYVVVDEEADGSPVVEKWEVKNLRLFSK